jgi:ABC-2 type transport system permease protein
MKALMDKHFYLFFSYLKAYLKYPISVFFKLIELPIQMFLYIFLWYFISLQSNLDYEYMVLYYLVTGLLTLAYSFVHISADIEDDILGGRIFNCLIRPYRYITPLISKYLAAMAVYSLVFIPVILLILLWGKSSCSSILFFILCSITGMLVEFFIWYTIGLLALYIDKIRGLIRIIAALRVIVSGSLVPLSMLPKALYNLFMILPFQCYIYTPVSVLTNPFNINENMRFLTINVIWLVTLIIISHYVFMFGLRKLKSSMS